MADLSSYINIAANVVISNTVSSNSVVSTTGNVNAGNITVSGIASVTGNVTANYFLGNGSLLSGISSSYGNANVVANLAALGSNPVSTTGNVTSGNISTSGLITATGNISGNYFVGNGSQLTGLAASYGNSNVSTFLAAYGSNTVSTTGNITSGNILTSGLITATGNIQGGNIRTAGLISATGNVTGGNLLTAGLSSATGNITGANILTSGLISATSNITSAANITGANVLTGGLISATANITGGNVRTAGLITATGNITGGNIITSGIITSTGNVTGNYFIGNGSQLTGIVSSTANSIINGNSNVVVSANSNVTVGVSGTAAVATFATTGEYVTGLISATGNIMGGNVLTGGLISATGNVIGNNIISNNINGTTPNISLVATNFTWTFDNTGNLTLPGNTININYANTTAVPFIGVPSWTDGGNITFSGTGADPTFPTSGVVHNKIYYRQIGPKTWQVNGKYQTATASGGTEGIGDYIIRLPASLQFDTTLATQSIYNTGLGISAAWTYVAIPESNGRYFYGATSEGGWDGGVVPFSSTTYRLILGSNAGSTYQPWGQGFAPVTLVNLAIVWSFTFQAA